jgi:hypothetical protein
MGLLKLASTNAVNYVCSLMQSDKKEPLLTVTLLTNLPRKIKTCDADSFLPVGNVTLISVTQLQEPNNFIVGYVITVGIQVVFVLSSSC